MRGHNRQKVPMTDTYFFFLEKHWGSKPGQNSSDNSSGSRVGRGLMGPEWVSQKSSWCLA